MFMTHRLLVLQQYLKISRPVSCGKASSQDHRQTRTHSQILRLALQEYVPAMCPTLPEGFDFRRTVSATTTPPYNSTILPLPEGRPTFLVHDPSLPDQMMAALRSYLQTAPGRDERPSSSLSGSLGLLSSYINNYALHKEGTSTTFFERMMMAVLFAVQQVDQNDALPETTAQAAVYHQIPDGLYVSYPGASPQLHLEVKSWSAFSQHAPNILRLARERQVLNLNRTETDHRAIVFKIGVSMLSRQFQIPYAILFGGDRYMIFTICPIPNTNLHGLICSDILHTLDQRIRFMPLMVFCLLNGRAGGIKIRPSRSLKIPLPRANPPLGQTRLAAKADNIKNYEASTNVLTGSMGGLSISQAKILHLTFELPNSERVTYDLTASSTSPGDAHFHTQRSSLLFVHFLLCLLLPFISRLLKIFPPSLTNPPSRNIKVCMTHFLGSGVVGAVFRGQLEGSLGTDWVCKVANDTPSKRLLMNEARVYAVLSMLQGSAVPQVYDLFVGHHIHVLAMKYAGQCLTTFEELTRFQRLSLWKSLQEIHRCGICHGDWRPENVVLSATGHVQVIDFSHAVFHNCAGDARCPELLAVYDVLQIRESEGENPNGVALV